MIAVFSAKKAAEYLGVSRSHFFAHIRPHLRTTNLSAAGSKKPLLRWKREVLDDFLNRRTEGGDHNDQSHDQAVST